MKQVLFALLHAGGVTRFARWWHRRRVIFLCWHGVTKRDAHSPGNTRGLHVNEQRFVAQLEYLRRFYHVISLSEYLAANRDGHALPNYCAVLTFDDGFRNFLTAAAPRLVERKMPATVFLITDKATERNGSQYQSCWSEEDDHTYLSWEEARFLQDKYGFEFGSHTCSHSILANLAPADKERELLFSYQELTANLGSQSASLSYPKGEYSAMVADDARHLGYVCAVTTDRGTNEIDHDRYTLGRCLIGDYDDVASFAVRATGLRWWLKVAATLLSPIRSSPAIAPERDDEMSPAPEF